ncbi:MAG: hypothetical protein ACYDA8_08825, partial [Deferrisomatales bacterium]
MIETVAHARRGEQADGPLPGVRGALLPDRAAVDALSALHRAVAAAQFYPSTHPSLQAALRDGYRAWAEFDRDYRLEEPGLELRSGGLWLGEARLGEDSPAVESLARTLAGHGIAAVRRQGALTFEGYLEWAGLLAAAPDVLRPRGGLAGAWRQGAFAPVLRLAGLAVAAAGEPPGGGPEPRPEEAWGAGLGEARESAALADPLVLHRLQGLRQRGARERRVLDLLVRLGQSEGIEGFLAALEELCRVTGTYLDEERHREAFLVVLCLYREAQNLGAGGAREGRREYLLEAVKRLVQGEFLDWLVRLVAAARVDDEAEAGEY